MDDQMPWMTLDQVQPSFVPESDPDTLGKLLLRAIADALAWFGGVEFDPDRTTDRVLLELYFRGVPYSPMTWFPESDSRHRKRCSRACRQLERDGYLARDTERLRNRVRSIVSTVFGIAWPLRHASEVRAQEVVDGLRKTLWGRELADELLDELANGLRR